MSINWKVTLFFELTMQAWDVRRRLKPMVHVAKKKHDGMQAWDVRIVWYCYW